MATLLLRPSAPLIRRRHAFVAHHPASLAPFIPFSFPLLLLLFIFFQAWLRARGPSKERVDKLAMFFAVRRLQRAVRIMQVG